MEKGNVPSSLIEYVNEIKLSPNVLSHLEETCDCFDACFKKLLAYNKMFVFYALVDSLYHELSSSSSMEGELSPKVQLKEDIFFDHFQISNARIHRIHKFVCNESEVPKGYRESEVKIAGIEYGEEKIYFIPPKKEEVPRLMREFIDVYREMDARTLHNNPFIKSALMHALFIKIHPYRDGNGRTGRMIHNIKFTALLNQHYNMNLKLCPLNISSSMRMNRLTYHERLNAISFTGGGYDNDAFNRWFEFCLNMADEQIYYTSNMVEKYGKESEAMLANKEALLEPSLVKKIEAMRFPRTK